MSVYEHFRKEEQPFIDQVLSWKEIVERTYEEKLTDFLDPRERKIVHMLIPTSDDALQVKHDGGGKYTERTRVIIAPFYSLIQKDDFQLTLLEATYPTKFVTLSHRDVLGAFLSLGLVRDKLGDIYVDNGKIQMIVATEIANFVRMNFTQIKQARVTFCEKTFTEWIENKPNWIESNQTVSSLRLDNVVKEIYNISRKLAVEAIKKQLIKVNFKVVDDAKFILGEDDLISFRRKGRSKLVKINGQTKKGKWRITTAKLK